MRLYIFILLLVLVSCNTSQKKTLNIACAANMQKAMDSIVAVYMGKTNVDCTITASSSGILTTQIENGAPYDIFISANMMYPEKLFDDQLATKPLIYARGSLILVYPKEMDVNLTLSDILTSNSINKIALADPKTAPYGFAAEECLNIKNLYDSLKHKIVFGESIGQVNQYATTQTADAVFTSKSFIIENSSLYNHITIDTSLYSPINQGVSLIKKDNHTAKKSAKQFLKFLESDRVSAILQYFGYSV